MEFTITYNDKDYSNCNKDIIFIKRILKDTFKRFAIPYAVLSFIVALVFTSTVYGGLYLSDCFFYVVQTISFLVLFVVVCLFVLIMQFLSGGKYIQRQHQGVNANTRIEITPQNIILDNGDINFVVKWSTVKDIYNRKHNIIVFISDMQVISIPKRIFNSEEEIANCWSYLNDCYNSARNS